MKVLILIAIALVSLNVFAAEEGENKKSECIYAQQGKRDKKIIKEESEKPKAPKAEVKVLSV